MTRSPLVSVVPRRARRRRRFLPSISLPVFPVTRSALSAQEFAVRDGGNDRVTYQAGVRWWCPRCEVGVTSMRVPLCWCCDRSMGPYPPRALTTPRSHLTAPSPEDSP